MEDFWEDAYIISESNILGSNFLCKFREIDLLLLDFRDFLGLDFFKFFDLNCEFTRHLWWVFIKLTRRILFNYFKCVMQKNYPWNHRKKYYYKNFLLFRKFDGEFHVLNYYIFFLLYQKKIMQLLQKICMLAKKDPSC